MRGQLGRTSPDVHQPAPHGPCGGQSTELPPSRRSISLSDKPSRVRTIVYDLLERLAAANDLPEPIVEFGALRVENQAHLPPIRSLFPGRAFSGADMSAGLGVDQRQDLHQLGIRTDSVGTALLIDTIEHVKNPKLALDEIRRCMAADGVLLLTSHFFFPIHQFPSDYWRFTAQGISALLADFHFSYAGEAGLRLFPHTVVGLAGGPGVAPENWRRLSQAVEDWQREGATSWKERALSLLPPVLVQRGYERYATPVNRRTKKS
jgi:hypothetical protein